MTKQRNVKIEEPGASPEEASPAMEDEEAVAPQEKREVAEQLSASPARPTTAQDAFTRQLAATQKLVGAAEALDHSHLNSRMAVMTNSRPADDNLPDARTINTDEIPYGRSVLTKQGYVCSTREDPRRFPK